MQRKKCTPEEAGISSKTIRKLVEKLNKYQHIHSFILCRDHKQIAAGAWKPYDINVPHKLFSLSKSFVSCAIGFAIFEKRITLDTPVLEIFPEYRDDVKDERFERMTIRHLLTMSSGHDRCASCFFQWGKENADFKKDFFSSPLAFEPGKTFIYNSGATFMLSAVIRRITGENPSTYLRPRMLNALDIKDHYWELTPDGTEFGGWGYHLTTEEISSFAEMLLAHGKVNGSQILPADYFSLATSKQINNSMNENMDWKQGYGFQFWRSRFNSFRADGAFGQYALVLPDQNITLSVTAGGKNMQNILDIFWETILPELHSSPLPEDPENYWKLQKELFSLALPVLHGKTPAKEYRISAEFAGETANITGLEILILQEYCQLEFIRINGKKSVLKGGWLYAFEGKTTLEDDLPYPYSATAEISSGKLKIKVYHCNAPYCSDFTFCLHDGLLTVQRERNLIFRSEEWQGFSGKAEASIKSFEEIQC